MIYPIYHDGSNSVIQESGTGNLNILTDTLAIKNAAGTENIIVGLQDSYVRLYHNNAIKLATTSTGVDVTGTVTADDVKNTIAGTYKLFGANGTAGNANYVTYAFEGDNNTGMFSGTADTLKFATGGSERMRIDSSGNVGIGTSSPLAPVVAKTAVTASSDKIVYGMTQSDNNAGRIVGMGIAATGSVANQGINFYTCLSSVQSERMRINEQGNVGIGTASPSSALDVTGTVTSNKFTLKYAGTDTFATIEGPNNRSLRFDLKDNGTSDIFEFRNRALDSLLKIDNTGHLTPLGGVYLGGTAAANKLDDYEEGTFNLTMAGGKRGKLRWLDGSLR